jgi:hypothetical protein
LLRFEPLFPLFFFPLFFAWRYQEGIQAYAAAKPEVGGMQGGYPQVLKGSNKVFAHPLPFNLIPQIDVFQVTRARCL